RSASPKVLEPIGRHFGVSDRVLNGSCARGSAQAAQGHCYVGYRADRSSRWIQDWVDTSAGNSGQMGRNPEVLRPRRVWPRLRGLLLQRAYSLRQRARQRQREGSAESDIGPTSRRVGCKIVPTPRGNDDGLTRLVILRCRDPARESPWLAGSLLQVR